MRKKLIAYIGTQAFSIRKSIFIIFFLLVFTAFCYVKYSIKQIENAYNVELKMDYCVPTLSISNWLKPALIIKNLQIVNKNKASGFAKVSFDSLILAPKYFKSLISFLQNYVIEIKAKNLKINEYPSNHLEISEINGFLEYADNAYTLSDLNIRPLKFRLTPKFSTFKNNKLRNKTEALTISEIFVNGKYSAISREISLELLAPNARENPNHSQNYTVKAKGTLSIAKQHSLPRGDIKITIEKFSHLLDHLHQVLIISTLADNIGSILGYPLPKKKLSDDQIKEMMTNSATLTLRFTKKAVFIGPFQIYP